ncbi:hypothetical protein [Niabella drilacis]|uniref:GRAM domain-containing protein n=1 Tax=Niabella drilacis (strain DSM 25811 / CCM 8410 / CCUG 62505 / LMG 26954 / E90) TaxID=1285928 RepID=A0A1G7BAW6_NIADE|nr:hypothetical protein [Niabella drilacis]SDE23385.1 hypothetical protein SAMN04487894_12814 [Niabella drilacis]
MSLELQPAETAIDTWAINYIGPNGKAATGKLTVTNQRLLFLPQHGADSLSLSVYNRKGLLELDKSDIKNVAPQKSFLSKKVLVTMSDNSVHTFNYGVMNIDKLVAAIQNS